MEQMNRDVKEVWGAGQQQVRNVYSNAGCFNLNLWMHTLVEVWAWERPQGQLSDRRKSKLTIVNTFRRSTIYVRRKPS